jgi:cation:H+ antiporter
MLTQLLIFVAALAALLYSARVFTGAAEKLGAWLGMSPFVVGVFIVGVGTSLPELISSILAVRQDVSEIVPGNVMGASISNLLLITGVVAWLNRRDIVLAKSYIFIDLHYLIGALMLFAVVAYDGSIRWQEAWVGIVAFVVYSLYLLSDAEGSEGENVSARGPFPKRAVLLLLAAGVGIYFGADYTVSSISAIAAGLGIPPSVIALTVLSLGTTLPELAVNVSAIRQGKAEMAVGNVLGSCIFNLMVVPGAAAMFGAVTVPVALLVFSLPFLLGSGLFFYLLAQDKTLSRWEGLLFILIYALFLLKAAGVA